MGLDIRVPLGMIFLLIGAILTLFGAFTLHSHLYDRSLGIDLNLIWGVVMMGFGGVMYAVGMRQRWVNDPGSPRAWERRWRR